MYQNHLRRSILIIYELINRPKLNDQLSVGLIVQLVEHCKGIAEPVQA